MAKRPGKLHLNAFLMPAGHHEASWRLPESDPRAHLDVAYYANLARIAERGKLDSLFLADSPVLWNNIGRRPSGQIEPTVLLAAIVQAGSSDDGKELAARYAEAVFTAQQTLEDAQQFYADLKAQTRALGRDPDTIKILPGIVPVIGATEAEALELDAELDRLIKPEYARLQLAQTLRVAPEKLELDAELPGEISADDNFTEAAKSRYALIVNLARRERLTVRQLIGRLGGGRGHRTFAGTPEQVADALQHWFEHGAADGFNVMAPVFPSGLERFVDHVVPILQKRGLFRSEYEGNTLREHYGLARPENANLQRSRLSGAA